MKRLRLWWLRFKIRICDFDIALAEYQFERIQRDLRSMRNKRLVCEAEYFLLNKEIDS